MNVGQEIPNKAEVIASFSRVVVKGGEDCENLYTISDRGRVSVGHESQLWWWKAWSFRLFQG